ncbi:MAG: M28 family metallopeptidase [Pseudomonadota bacterium]
MSKGEDGRRQFIDPHALLRRLAALPRRVAGTAGERETLRLLEDTLRGVGASVALEPFYAPRTYLPMIWWASGLLVASLMLAAPGHWLWPLIALVVLWGALRYFDWRWSWLIALPPWVKGHNLTARLPQHERAPRRLILMAHYDAAPVSFAYRRNQVKRFRETLLLSVAVMALAALVVVMASLGWRHPALLWARYGLGLALLAQALVASIDFWRYGYSPAVNDNASGVAAAMAVAERLWRAAREDAAGTWSVELVLTGAEEAGMIGAQRWLDRHRHELSPETCFLINIDTVGAGDLKLVARTGTLSTLTYANPLMTMAQALADKEVRFHGVTLATHRVADFDSVWFARAGLPALTLAAYDGDGLMPHIHRPEDRLEAITPQTIDQSIAFATALGLRLMQGPICGVGDV